MTSKEQYENMFAGINTILRSNIMGGYHDRRWSGLQEKMFPWTNDFPDVKCTDPNCTQSHLGR